MHKLSALLEGARWSLDEAHGRIGSEPSVSCPAFHAEPEYPALGAAGRDTQIEVTAVGHIARPFLRSHRHIGKPVQQTRHAAPSCICPCFCPCLEARC